jgi:hypothetical protein
MRFDASRPGVIKPHIKQTGTAGSVGISRGTCTKYLKFMLSRNGHRMQLLTVCLIDSQWYDFQRSFLTCELWIRGARFSLTDNVRAWAFPAPNKLILTCTLFPECRSPNGDDSEFWK